MNLKFITPLILLFGLFQNATVLAADKQYQLQEDTHQALSEAHKLIEEDKNKQALGILTKLLSSANEYAYDKAVIKQTLGYIYYGLEQIDLSLKAFVDAVESNALPPDVQHDLHFTIAQLSIFQDQYDAGLHYLKKWFAKESSPGADAHLLAASVYFELEQYKKSIPHLKDAIRLSDSAPKNWYDMLLAAYFETKQLNHAALLLEKLIVRYPDEKNFWLQLISVWQQLDKDNKALAVNELAYRRGLLNSKEKLNLAKSYLYLEMPYKAASLLESEIDSDNLKPDSSTLELLINSWLSAQENDKAIQVLQTLNNLEESSEHKFRLAQLLIDQQKWRQAVPLLEKVTKDTGFEHIGEAWLLLGMSQYELNDSQASLASFGNAMQHKNSQEQARWWMQQINENMENQQG